MLRQLKFRDRLLAMAAVPILATAVVAAGLLLFIGGAGTAPYGIFALVAAAVSALIAFKISQSVVDSMDELTKSAMVLAESHKQLAEGKITVADLQPVPVADSDELAQIATAINTINFATVAATEAQRAEVKEGLSNIVVNLARRSQTLLDRQVEYLDQLESTEEDPERLGELFKVDHLATRMRRNAESLMVLAEADPGRRRGAPVEIADVLRVAMGEVENYQHIDLVDVDDGQVGPTIAVDLAHMVAELMENATQFSPPSAPVEVDGKFDGSGSFVVAVADNGMGLTETKLADANRVLADPPELGLGMGRSLGFMVIGRLAKRVGATVSLEQNGDHGTRALVSIPTDVFVTGSTKDAKPSETEEKAAEQKAPAPKKSQKKSQKKKKKPSQARPAAAKKTTDTTSDADSDSKSVEQSPEPEEAPVEVAEVDVPADAVAETDAGQSTDAAPEAEANTGDAATDEDGAGNSTALEKLLGLGSATQTDTAEETGPVDWSTSPFAGADSSESTAEDADDTDEADESDEPDESDEVSDSVADDDTDGDSDEEVSDEEVSDESDDEEADDSWTPPEVTAPGPSKLEEAVPSGEAFESGVASLLEEPETPRNLESGSRALRGDGATSAGLTKRQRGASQVPIGQGRPVAASGRDPEEVRSMLSRYRQGLKGGAEGSEESDADSDDKTDKKDR